MLFKLTKNLLPLYRDAYEKDWPKNNVAFGLINHYIDRIEKFPEWQEKVHFYSIDGKFSEDATFVFTNGYYIYFDSLTKDREKLKTMLQNLNYDDEKLFVEIKGEFRDVILDLIGEKSLIRKKDYGAKNVCTEKPVLDLRTYERVVAALPNEFYLDNLKESDAELILQRTDSNLLPNRPDILRTCIKYNLTTGLYRKADNRLIAWSMVTEFGLSGGLWVEEEYRNQNIGLFVAATHALKVIEKNKYFNAGVNHGNEKSLKFTLLVSTWVDNISVVLVENKSLNLRGKL